MRDEVDLLPRSSSSECQPAQLSGLIPDSVAFYLKILDGRQQTFLKFLLEQGKEGGKLYKAFELFFLTLGEGF